MSDVRAPSRPASGAPAGATQDHANPLVHVLGRVLAGGFAVAGRLRPADKPLHPRGEVRTGTLTRTAAEPLGVDWLDRSGTDEVLVRFSRSAGLPVALPDVLGLAVRVPVDGGHADLLFSTSGTGRTTRFVLAPARRPASSAYSTLVPFRTARGSVVLLAVGRGDDPDRCFDLRAAVGRGPWHTFGRLDVPAAPPRDEAIAFDSVLNHIPGLEPYPWVRELRAGAYRAARRSRGDDRTVL